MYDNQGNPIKGVFVNYNGNDGKMEATQDKQNYITLNFKDIPKLVVYPSPSAFPKDFAYADSIVLLHYPNDALRSDYYVALYQDEEKNLLLDYYVDINTVTERPPGQIIEKKKFVPKEDLILVANGKINRFDTNKKSIESTLKPYGDIGNWTKSNKLKSTSYEGMAKFLSEN